MKAFSLFALLVATKLVTACGSAESNEFDESSPTKWNGTYRLESMVLNGLVNSNITGNCDIILDHKEAKTYYMDVHFDCAFGAFPLVKRGKLLVEVADTGEVRKLAVLEGATQTTPSDDPVQNSLVVSPTYFTWTVTDSKTTSFMRLKKQ